MPLGEEFFVSGVDPVRVEICHPGETEVVLRRLGAVPIEAIVGHKAFRVPASIFASYEQQPGVSLNIVGDSRSTNI